MSKYVVTEGQSSVWHYHISIPDRLSRSLCGKPTMPTEIPLSYWNKTPKGHHIPESWCGLCHELIKAR